MGPAKQQDPPEDLHGGHPVPMVMVEQAEAAVTSTHDASSSTPAERRHMGHDVAMVPEPSVDSERFDEDVPPPAYGEHYGSIQNEQDGFGTDATVGNDGRVNITIKQTDRKLLNLLMPALRQQQQADEKDDHVPPPAYIPPFLGGDDGIPPPPPMNVVIQVVGSRGDVQPFVALGKVLKDTYKHRVRLATHPVFKEFVTENGLEFFSIGGDPAQLMAFMVKNPGLMPGFDSMRDGDVGRRRKDVGEYVRGCWRSCFEAGDGMGPAASDETIEDWTARQPASAGDDSNKPFVADCIIANPPSFAHIHCAEKLGIPLHIMFTMPYSPTQAFPHPLANIQSSNADPNLTNYMSYTLIEVLTWQGLSDVINRFRQKSLGLEPIALVRGPGMLQRAKVPHTYCWSPALIPKPKDWAQHISISGFFLLNLASNYTPAPDLQAFLDAGPPPIYIGFGSIVLDDPNGMTKLIFEAARKTGRRVLLSKGWGGVGADELGIPENVFMLGNVPHDWLFKHVCCVVHHGGAGTTAAGITAGRPTLVVPFFGDQQFWGAMVARAGAGPDPIPHKQLTAENLVEGIRVCLKPESQARAHELADKIAAERGSDLGAQYFHQMLDVDTLRCNVAPSRIAVWRLKRTQVRLSAMAACTLANEGLLSFNELKPFRPREYEVDDGPWEPISGGAAALVGSITSVMMGVADFPVETLKALKIHPDSSVKKKKKDSESGQGTSSYSEHSSGSSTGDKSIRRSSETETAIASGASTPAASRSNSSFNFQDSLSRIQSPVTPIGGTTRNLSPSGRGSIPQSMADALKGQLKGSKPRSRSNSNSKPGDASQGSGRGGADEFMETAMDTGKGVRKILGAGFSSPMDLAMGLTKGFHNAPKLYGDDTVRKPDKITDFKSGIRAATKEFGYGMYDGITGVVTQPMRGAQKDGAAGFLKGIGRGLGGIYLKPGAAIFGVAAYPMMGVYKEMQKQFGSSVQNYIIAARTAQGFDEWVGSSVEERADVVQRWKALQKDLKKKRNPDEMVRDILEEQKKKRFGKKNVETDGMGGAEKTLSRTESAMSSHTHKSAHGSRGYDAESAAFAAKGSREKRHSQTPPVVAQETDDEDLKEAIRLSVQETSRGDSDEDAAVEEAIRESLAELQQDRESGVEGRAQPVLAHDEEVERVLAQSLKEQRRQRSSDSEWDSDSEGEYQRAIKESQHPAVRPDPGHLGGTTQEEFEQQQGGGEKSQQERSEEDVVMEYVKKQSLMEEEHRRKLAGKAKVPQRDEKVNDDDDDDDDDFKKAMSISMQDDSRHGEASGR
ncbi:hypothetical protein LTR08_006282 [Meristemomyces frigidus]|nr:hypothetical protein LTR08_006282 [Meristemomyces frigidus]